MGTPYSGPPPSSARPNSSQASTLEFSSSTSLVSWLADQGVRRDQPMKGTLHMRTINLAMLYSLLFGAMAVGELKSNWELTLASDVTEAALGTPVLMRATLLYSGNQPSRFSTCGNALIFTGASRR